MENTTQPRESWPVPLDVLRAAVSGGIDPLPDQEVFESTSAVVILLDETVEPAMAVRSLIVGSVPSAALAWGQLAARLLLAGVPIDLLREGVDLAAEQVNADMVVRKVNVTPKLGELSRVTIDATVSGK